MNVSCVCVSVSMHECVFGYVSVHVHECEYVFVDVCGCTCE